MNRNRPMLTSMLAIVAAGLVLEGCNQKTTASQPITGAPIASLGLDQSAPPAPPPPAPLASQLAPAAPVRVSAPRRPAERYRYVDDAYAMSDAFADSPPDYSVDYDGGRPWIWRAQSGAYRMVEQTPDGEREYYYAAGGDEPFLVRDSGYSYAYDGGVLVEVYDSYGRPLPYDVEARDADLAGRYLSRARALYYAALHQQRQAAYAAEWQARRDSILASRQQWAAEQQRDADWRRWHDERQAEHDQVWGQERQQRQTYAAGIAAVAAGAVAGAVLQHQHDQGQAREAAQQAREQQAQADAARLAAQQQGQAMAGRQQQAQAEAAQRAQAEAAQRAQAEAAQRAQAQASAQMRQQQAQSAAARQAQAAGQARQQQAQADIARRAQQQALAQQQAQAAQRQHAADLAASQQQAQRANAQHRAEVEAQKRDQAANQQRAQAMNQHAAQAAAQRQQAQAAQQQQRAQAAMRQQAENAANQHAAQAAQQQQRAQAARQQAEAANQHAQQAATRQPAPVSTPRPAPHAGSAPQKPDVKDKRPEGPHP